MIATNSRYDFMKDSQVKDIDNSIYPDVLSLNYNTFIPREPLTPHEMNDEEVTRVWKLMKDYYGVALWDDIVLTLNGVPHRNLLAERFVIFLPALQDITGSFKKEK
jgi:hypothetical protein